MSNTDHWINSSQVFVHNGQSYGVDKTGATVSLGEEKKVIDVSMPDISKLKVIKDVKSKWRRKKK